MKGAAKRCYIVSPKLGLFSKCKIRHKLFRLNGTFRLIRLDLFRLICVLFDLFVPYLGRVLRKTLLLFLCINGPNVTGVSDIPLGINMGFKYLDLMYKKRKKVPLNKLVSQPQVV